MCAAAAVALLCTASPGQTHVVLAALLGLMLLVVVGLLIAAYRRPIVWLGEAAVGIAALAICAVLWATDSGRSVALLAFPLVWTLGALVCRQRWSRALAILLLSQVAALAVGEAAGIFEPVHSSAGWMATGVAFSLLGAHAASTATLSNDVRSHLLALERERNASAAALAQADAAENYDEVTGLPNRRLALSFGEAACRQLDGKRGGQSETVAVTVFEFTDLTVVLDSVGEGARDAYLQEISKRLLGAADGQFVARVAAGEFAVVTVGLVGDDELGVHAGRMLEQVAKRVVVGGIEMVPTVSAGIARYPADGDAFHVVLANAVRACVDSQMSGAGTYRYFDAQTERRTAVQLRLIADLRDALEGGGAGLSLAYQPHVEIVSGTIGGVEALLRWQHPKLGSLPTNEVIELAEQSGLVIPLGAWVLQRACAEAARWKNGPLAHASVSVNVSAVQFERTDIVDTVRKALMASGLPAERLTLEFTEGLMLGESRRLHESLEQLVDMGVRMTVDDFGTGYTNIGYLQRCKIHTLKLDRSFIAAGDDSARTKTLIHAVVALGRALDIDIVAEGIENRNTAMSMMQIGCRYGQGYLWAKPVSAAEMEAAVAERPVFAPILQLGVPFPAA